MNLGANTTLTAARLLATGWQTGAPIDSAVLDVHTAADAVAIQQATWRLLDTGAYPGGWKVGAKGPEAPATCAPLPQRCLRDDGALVSGPGVQRRGIELELALRVARPIDARVAADPLQLAASFDAACAAIEVVESRLSDWEHASPLAKLADLQSHHALVLGPLMPLNDGLPDLRSLDAVLSFDDACVARTRGGNSAQDLPRLLHELALQALAHGAPLQPGQIVTTGTCTGLLFAREGARVQGAVGTLPPVTLRFA